MVQKFHVAIPEEHQETWVLGIDSGADTSLMHTILSVSVNRANTIICYDHWEDGLEADLTTPTQASTEVWGNADISDGCAPGFPCSINADDVLTQGQVIALVNDVPLPRNPANIYYDGRDVLYSTGVITLTRAGWPTNIGASIAGGTEVYDDTYWGTDFTLPVGIDSPGTGQMFEYTAISLLAEFDNTTVQIDVDGNGLFTDPGDISTVLDRGEAYMAEALNMGAHVQADRPIEAHSLVGDIGTRYEARWFSLTPFDDWDDTYYAPVPDYSNAPTPRTTTVHVYNPGTSSIDVDVTYLNGTTPTTTTITVPAAGPATGLYNFVMPSNSTPTGARFVSKGGATFYAISSIDTTSGFDWAYPLIPGSQLSSTMTLGWAPGTSETTPTTNADNVRLIPVADADVEVDFDNDGTPDQTFANVLGLQSLDISDTADWDMTGARIWAHAPGDPATTVRLTGAWGENPLYASAGNSTHMDVGTVILPAPEVTLLKQWALQADLNGNGLPDPGDTIEYTVKISNSGDVNLTNVVVRDRPSSVTSYVAGTFSVNNPFDTGDVIQPDDPPAPNGTAFPLDDDTGVDPSDPDDGWVLSSLQVGDTAVLKYHALIDVTLDAGQATILNTAEVLTVGGRSASSATSTVINRPELQITKTSDVTGNVAPGQTITYQIQVTNPSSSGGSHTELEVTDTLPPGVTYVPQSTVLQVPTRDPVFRLTEAYIAAGSFTGSQFDLTLPNNLQPNYFVMVQGNTADRDPRRNMVRLSGDPFGTGGLATTAGPDQLRLVRDRSGADWVGVVTVVECLTNCTTDGFRLVDALVINHGTAASGSATSAAFDPNQVMVMGGYNGPGCSTPKGGRANYPNCLARFYTSGSTTVNWTRDASVNALESATSTALVLEWGNAWTVQSAHVTGTAGGPGIDQVSEYATAALGTAVARANTWVWGTGHTDNNGPGTAGGGAVVTLGDGVSVNATENTVAVGLEYSQAIDFQVWALTHPALAVDHVFKVDGDAFTTQVAVPVNAAPANQRMAVAFNSLGSTLVDDYPENFLSARYVTDTSIRLERQLQYDGNLPDTKFAAWVQGVDFSGIYVAGTTLVYDNIPGGANPDLVDGNPATGQLVTAADNITLASGVTATVTFAVTVENPIGENMVQYLNQATAFSKEAPTPVYGFHADVVDVGGAIGRAVFFDADGDGVMDPEESGIPNVAVSLYDPGPDGAVGGGDDVLVDTTVTGTSGLFRFQRLPAGTYYLDLNTATLPGGGAGLTLSAPATDPSSIITIGSGSEVNEDFGFANATPGAAVFGDLVWADDGDGLREPGEPGIDGVTVNLVQAGADRVFGTPDDTTVATTTTAGGGLYLFTNQPTGEYRIDVDETSAPLAGYAIVPAGPQNQPDPSQALFAERGGLSLDVDFAFQNASAFDLEDRVWYDVNRDGVFDVTEKGMPGVRVELLDASSVVVAETVSAADGTVTFKNLLPGTYTLRLPDSQPLTLVAPTTSYATARSRTLTLSGATSNTSFGFDAEGQLSGTIFSDANDNGIRDGGEPAIPGVTVNLVDAETGTVIQTLTTDSRGGYNFRGLAPAQYRIDVVTGPGTPLQNYSQTGDPDVVSPPSCTGTSQCDNRGTAVVATSTGRRDLDFGYRNANLSSILGTLFEDTDRDGELDSGTESGIAGVTVELYSVAAGDWLAETVTDASGAYSFDGLPDGTYRVAVTDAKGVLADYELTVGASFRSVTVAGAGVTGVDFGYVRRGTTAAIGDSVWIDDDEDGERGPAEAGIAGVSVTLWDAGPDRAIGGGDDISVATQVTSADGSYLFGGLSRGVYFVTLDTATLPGGGAGLVETSYPTGADPHDEIFLSDGELQLDNDFGFTSGAGVASIGDLVWYDGNSNGRRDLGEAGLAGVTVVVTGPGGTANYVTDARGMWRATSQASGTYYVWVDTSTLPAGLNTTPTNLPVGNPVYGFTLAPGDDFSHIDFGFDGGTMGSIGDRVFLDSNGDGVEDPGEPGLALVSIDLLDAGGAVLVSTLTDETGTYTFSGLPAATYSLRVTDTRSTLVGLNPTLQPPATITLTAGQVVTTADFGYAASGGTGVIGDTVWMDTNGDGLRDATENGVQGVGVRLWEDVNGNGVINPGTDNVVRLVYTDAAGTYEFSGLTPAAYIAEVYDVYGVLAGLSQTGDPDEAGTCSVCDGRGLADLTAVNRLMSIDFGYDATGGGLSIAGTTFEDEDKDAYFDETGVSEPRIPVTTISLYRQIYAARAAVPGNVLIGRQLADANGDYVFTGLAPGTYLVTSETKATYAEDFFQTTQASTGGVQVVTLTTTDSLNNDFGYYRSGVTTTPVTLAWFDARRTASGTHVAWQTSTETGNLGFNLYRHSDRGLEQLNRNIIVSPQFNSTAPQTYDVDLPEVISDRLVLEDIDVTGKSRFHGPFEVGQTLGRRQTAGRAVPWATIRNAAIASNAAAGRAEQRLVDLPSPGPKPVRRQLLARLYVSEPGLQRVDATDLAAAGIDLRGLETRSLALVRAGTAIPMAIEGGPVIGQRSRFIFVGEPLRTLYTDEAPYELWIDASRARRIEEVPGGVKPTPDVPLTFVETRTYENDRIYSFSSPSGDPWIDTYLLAYGSPAEAVFPFDVPADIDLHAPATIRVDLWGVTDFPVDPDHHVQVLVNGAILADVTFDGMRLQPIEVTLDRDTLVQGENELRLRLPHDTEATFDMVAYDKLTLRAARYFVARDDRLTVPWDRGPLRGLEATGFGSPGIWAYRVEGERVVQLVEPVVRQDGKNSYAVRLPGTTAARSTTYLATAESAARPRVEVPPRRRLPQGGEAQLLVIAHSSFVDGLGSYVQRRRSQGWTVDLLDVASIYDSYGYGDPDPEAIRRCIAEAVVERGTRAVLLVGGDTYDYHDNLGLGSVSFIPTFYVQTDNIIHYTPADPLFGDVDGDGLPDIPVGRLPVRTQEELTRVLAAIADYESSSSDRVLIAVDEVDRASGTSFSSDASPLVDAVPPEWDRRDAYAELLGAGAARQVILDELSSGVTLASWVGHSGTRQWSLSSLLTAGDLLALPGRGTSAVAQWGCWTMYFVDPRSDSLGQAFVLGSEQRAPVAALAMGATTLTSARAERALARALAPALMIPGTTVGEALIHAKRVVHEELPAAHDIFAGWTILGDPTLVIRR